MVDYYRNGFNIISNVCYQYLNDYDFGQRYNSIRINAFASYDFYHLKEISSVFNSLDLSLMFTFNSGYPYYYDLIRAPIDFYSGTTPIVHQFDLKIEKGFQIYNNLNLDLIPICYKFI